MINLEWRPFQVDLSDFKKWMDLEFEERSDGFATNETGVSVFVLEETPSDVTAITAKWDSLVESEEQVKLARPQLLAQAIVTAKVAIIAKRWADMTETERKIVVGVPLDFIDEELLLSGPL